MGLWKRYKNKYRTWKRSVRPKINLSGKYYPKAVKMLTDVTRILNENNIRYALDAGTLLGLKRDNDLIPWDDDIDIVLHIDDVEKFRSVFKDITRCGWRITDNGLMGVTQPPWKKGDIRTIKIRNRNLLYFGRGRLVMDVFILYPHENHYWWANMGNINRVDAKYFDVLDTINWKNVDMKIPNFSDDYLSLMFGPWQTPDQNFDSKHKDGTILITEEELNLQNKIN